MGYDVIEIPIPKDEYRALKQLAAEAGVTVEELLEEGAILICRQRLPEYRCH